LVPNFDGKRLGNGNESNDVHMVPNVNQANVIENDRSQKFSKIVLPGSVIVGALKFSPCFQLEMEAQLNWCICRLETWRHVIL